MVLQARGEAPEAKLALGELCENYWMPVFRFLRREGREEDESRELAQEFFARLLSRNSLDHVDPRKGRFRSYLLGALKHFLLEERRNAARQKGEGTPWLNPSILVELQPLPAWLSKIRKRR